MTHVDVERRVQGRMWPRMHGAGMNVDKIYAQVDGRAWYLGTTKISARVEARLGPVLKALKGLM